MSYILEALKKAQAERQLGSAPTLDALPVHPPLLAGTRRSSTPAMVGVAAVLVAVVAAGVALHWWSAPAPAPAVVANVAQAPAPAAVPAPAAAVAVPAPAPATAASAPLVVAPPSAPVKPAVRPAPAPASPAIPAPAAPVEKTAGQGAADAAASKPVEERLPTLRELPDNVRAGIPQLSFGGYMYSNNPADRLILVDKVLRHEGEEVAPGLVLEKLLPKAAQLNYRGTRYLVPI